jgi:HlyD family type I secretion membrane fusion protein
MTAVRQDLMAERPPVRGPILAGLAAVGIGIGGFGSWAALTPLSSAAVAPGIVQVDSNRKAVQHRDGGIIAELLVREGDRVAAGQLLLRLDDVESRAAFDVLEQQYHALLAQQARLTAERDQTELRWPAILAGRAVRPEVASILAGQEHVLRSRQDTLAGQVDIMNRRIAQYGAQISALEAQLSAGERQRELIREELTNVRELLAKRLERRPRLLALEREGARLDGAQGDYRGRIAQMREAIAEAELQIIELRAARLEEVTAELQDVDVRRAEVEEKLAAAEVLLVRREVLAPEAGTVLDLRYFAQGGVIPAGGTILDLLPDEDRLVIDARVQPLDIEEVQGGMAAQVVLTGLKGRATPYLDGSVVRVSPDALSDERTGAPYFLARVEVERAQLSQLSGIELIPGMPAEVLIVNRARTALDYLVQPLKDSFRRAWREQ